MDKVFESTKFDHSLDNPMQCIGWDFLPKELFSRILDKTKSFCDDIGQISTTTLLEGFLRAFHEEMKLETQITPREVLLFHLGIVMGRTVEQSNKKDEDIELISKLLKGI